MKLSEYPRPAHDSGWGLHGPALLDWRYPPGYVDQFRRMGLSWFKHLGMLHPTDGDLAWVRELAAAGIEPVVRLYVDRRFPRRMDADELRQAVSLYVAAGAHYIESGNECNLDCEWEDGQFAAYQDRHIETLVDLWLEDARYVREAGGIPVVYAMSVGGSDGRLAHHWWADWLRCLADYGRLAALDGAAWGVHCGALNHPLAYPLDPLNVADKGITETDVCDAMVAHDDSACYQSVRLIQRMLRDAGKPDVPILSTEGGCFSWDASDARYPETTPESQRDMLLAIYRRMNPAHAEYWGDALFAQCSWLAIGGSAWAQDQWFENPRTGGHLPIVAALEAEPRFERRLSMGDVPDLAAACVHATAGQIVYTLDSAGHLAIGEEEAVDVAPAAGVGDLMLVAPWDAYVEYVGYEPSNRGYHCGLVDLRTVYDRRDFGEFEPWPNGSYDTWLEVGLCHCKGAVPLVAGATVPEFGIVAPMGWSGKTVPEGPGGRHLHLILWGNMAGDMTFRYWKRIDPARLVRRWGSGGVA